MTFARSRSPRSFAIWYSRRPKLPAKQTTPFLLSMLPGEPTPIHGTSSTASPAAPSASNAASASCSVIASSPQLTRVGRFARAMI